LTLLPEERKAGSRFDKQIVIQSSGLAAGPGMMKNKNWFPERFQAVSDAIRGSVNVIQLGLITDPPIQGSLDLRGKTTLRESAAILASSQLFIGQVGFLMHLARAVDCRSVIVYGGREDPSVSGYRANENLVGRTPCSFCWQRNKCDFDHECMQMISVDDTVAAVGRQLDRFGSPLEPEYFELGAKQ
jgi:ADP-heptose:LPS heptosyltransferase